MTIELTEDEYQNLNLALGWALGAAVRFNDRIQFRAILRLANAVNRGNPNWKPYDVTKEADGQTPRV